MSKKKACALPDGTEQLLTKAQLALWLNFTNRSIDNRIARGELPPAIQIGNRGGWRWRRSTVERFLAEREAAAANA